MTSGLELLRIDATTGENHRHAAHTSADETSVLHRPRLPISHRRRWPRYRHRFPQRAASGDHGSWAGWLQVMLPTDLPLGPNQWSLESPGALFQPAPAPVEIVPQSPQFLQLRDLGEYRSQLDSPQPGLRRLRWRADQPGAACNPRRGTTPLDDRTERRHRCVALDPARVFGQRPRTGPSASTQSRPTQSAPAGGSRASAYPPIRLPATPTSSAAPRISESDRLRGVPGQQRQQLQHESIR